ncbi:hypothetical protein [Pararhizobium sp.]|uniref:hypothetical protein n=1 Tax=Pararhizobium sp. TaxID=1977563 RepID=UPI003D13C85A
MKHKILLSIAHNLADSIASGQGFPIGYYLTDVFDEAAKSPGGKLEVDMLSGVVTAGLPTDSLRKAILLYKAFLPDLCTRQSAAISDFRQLTVQYHAGFPENRFLVTIEDANGRRSSAEYVGTPGQQAKILDKAGRPRPKVF